MKSSQKKHLSYLVALCLGATFCITSIPNDASAADITVTANGATYTFSNGTTADSSTLVSTVNGLLTSGNNLTVDKNTALALSNQNLSLGSGSTVHLLNSAGTPVLNISGGSTTSNVYVTGTSSAATVSGSNVNLGSISYDSSHPITANLTGTNTIQAVTADAGTVQVTGGGTTTVDTLNIENNSSVAVAEGTTINTSTLNYTSTGTVSNAGTLNANTVTIDASKVSTSDISNLSLSSAGTVTITNTTSAADSAAYAAAVKDSLPAGSTVTVTTTTTTGTTTTTDVTGTGTNADTSAANVYAASKTDPFTNKAPSSTLVEKYGSGSEVAATAQAAGKLAAMPSLGGQRAMGLANKIIVGNVMHRISELRSEAATTANVQGAYDSSDNNIWADVKYSNTDVKGDYFDKSKVKITNYQLGYDKRLSTNSYLGAYIGTMTGHVEFDDYTTDIDSAFNFGIYGTQLLGNGRYFNYVARYGTLKNKFDTVKWNTKDLGLTLEYGQKMQRSKDLFLTPYIQFNYDHFTNDDVTFASGNMVKADDSNNLDVKVGLDLEKVLNNGDSFYGGIAYSHGLSGKYQSYMNNIVLPSSDNKASIIYVDAGYKHRMSDRSTFDLNVEKTFCDYTGWTVAGRINFLF